MKNISKVSLTLALLVFATAVQAYNDVATQKLQRLMELSYHTPEAIQANTAGPENPIGKLIEEGANPNIMAGYKTTVLMRAVGTGDTNLVKKVLNAGANVNALDESRTTALTSAAREGSVEMTKLLLAHGADPNKDNGRALVFAIMDGREGIIKELLNAGADVTLGENDKPNANKPNAIETAREYAANPPTQIGAPTRETYIKILQLIDKNKAL